MSTSAEYLAALGIDTSDMDKALHQTVTLLGHVGTQFDELSGKTGKAERAMLGGAAATKKSTTEMVKANVAAKEQEGNLARLRYAVYDVSNAMTVGGVAAAAFVAGIVGTNVAFEREFAEVRRTVGVTGDSADELYDKFIRISTSIPVAFSSLSEIGTLAGQLGVVEDRVASFTETTAKFAATTDVSTEASATAFGRLDQLIDGVDGRYQNLASSILNVGINSVATESSIISIASQIAATGNQAGLTADEVIGLSSSLASLGVAPEAARGTILRVFSKINAAVSEGGEKLSDFANISNLTYQDFRDGWGSDFTTTFLAFLNGVNESGNGAEASLRGLGITATRDLSAMLKLSQNTDAVAKNLALAATGFEDVSILADNFGVIAETNASRLQILGQSIQALAATAGEATSGGLSYFLEYLQRILTALTEFTNTPIGQGIAFFTTIVGVAAAVLLLVGAAALRTAGTFLALKTAIGDTYLQTMLAKGGFTQLTASLFGAAGATAAFGAAIKVTGVGLLITGGLYLLGEAVGWIGQQMRSGAEKAEEYFGSLDGLSEAITADNAVLFANQMDRVNEAFTEGVKEGGDWIDALKSASEAQAALKSRTDEAGGAIDAQTLRIGTNTEEWLRNTLASSEAFQSLFTDLDQLNRLTGKDSFTSGDTTVSYGAFDLTEYIRIASQDGEVAANAFFDAWLLGLNMKFADEGVGNPLGASIDALGGTETTTKVYEAGAQIGNALIEGTNSAVEASLKDTLFDELFGLPEKSAEEAKAYFSGLQEDIYGVINAEAELSANTQKLGADFANNGAQVASSGSAMQAVIASIYSSSSGAPEAANRMQGLFNALVNGSYASRAQLAPLAAMISALADGGEVKAAAFDMTGFAQGIEEVGKSAGGSGGGAAKAVRTLLDYASDLSNVFSRSFDIRFGGAQGADDITSGWLKIKDAIAATNLEISNYQTEMQGLSADKAIREYWLSVAENYGDALRAGQLRAEIAEIDGKLTKTAGELADAQAEGSKSLTGNSQAAIDNRKEVLGLVGSYQDYITSLAAAGVPQAELQARAAQLKREFIDQATQLGYNAGELSVYASAFDDVSIAISRVPRNITVAANVNPALQALNELEAKAKSISNSTYSGPSFSGANIAKQARGMLISAKIAELSSKIPTTHFSGAGEYAALLRSQIASLTGQLNSGSYRKGGYTGDIPPWQDAGRVHGREFVLNQTGTSMFPRQVLDAANQGRQMNFGAPRVAQQKFPDTMRVELSPIDRDLIAQGAQVTVMIGADEVGRSASSAYGNDEQRGAS